MKLIYAADARIPSEKAHPFQITQMCEAFARCGAEVMLIYPARTSPPPYDTHDIWKHYGLERTFAAECIFCIDAYPAAERLPAPLKRIWLWVAARLASLSYTLALLARLRREKDALIYSRDALTLWAVQRAYPQRGSIYEAHTFPQSEAGLRLRRAVGQRARLAVVITEHLRERYQGAGVQPVIVAHDGIRPERFAVKGDRATWRAAFGWPGEAFIVGYMGRFHTLGMDKGVGDLLEAVLALRREGIDARLALVGGPDESVEALRGRSTPPEIVIYPGQVPAAEVPGYLRAFDVCAMPFPWTEHFAYFASPMKLFEYMASGSAVVATDLPATGEIIEDGVNGLLVPPSDPAALAAALRRLHDDRGLAERLAEHARRDVHEQYTWEARARHILDAIAEGD